ncbi:Uncharacterised protein family UPF0313 like protein, partial [Aduncisulcus paluster]
MIGQPDVKSDIDIKRLGEPKLYWGVSGGSIDSMVSNYTATRKFRNSDDYTPGGIEASLRRVTHYDYWQNKLKKPILFDSKADVLVYGMGEIALRELTEAIAKGEDYR